MNIVSIECPNCGGRIDRDKSEYFANCPFCGTEVCFDEIKGEAQSGQIDELKDRVEAFEKRERFDEEGRSRIRKWIKWRNISYAAISGATFLGFFFVGLGSGSHPENDIFIGIGAVIFISMMTLFFACPPALAAHYPDYDLINGKVNFADRLAMYVKIAATSIGIGVISAFAAYIVLKSMGRA